MNQLDTIAAISTPYGKGGIAVLRISGEDAYRVAERVFVPKNGKILSEIGRARAVYGDIFETDGTGKRQYNARIFLTDEGQLLAKQILDKVKFVQDEVDEGITEEELRSFYKTLSRLSQNFVNISKDFRF